MRFGSFKSEMNEEKNKIINFISKCIKLFIIEPLLWFFLLYPGKRKYIIILELIFLDILLLIFKHLMTNQLLQQSPAIIGLHLIYKIELVFFFLLFWRLIWYFILNPLDFIHEIIPKLINWLKNLIKETPDMHYHIYKLIKSGNTDIVEEIYKDIENIPYNLKRRKYSLKIIIHYLKTTNILSKLKINYLNSIIKALFYYYCFFYLIILGWWFTWLNMIFGNISLNQSFKLLFSSIPVCGNLWEILSYLAKLQLVIALPVSISFGIVITANRGELVISYIKEFINWLKTPPQPDLLGSLMDELKNSTTGK